MHAMSKKNFGNQSNNNGGGFWYILFGVFNIVFGIFEYWEDAVVLFVWLFQHVI